MPRYCGKQCHLVETARFIFKFEKTVERGTVTDHCKEGVDQSHAVAHTGGPRGPFCDFCSEKCQNWRAGFVDVRCNNINSARYDTDENLLLSVKHDRP